MTEQTAPEAQRLQQLEADAKLARERFDDELAGERPAGASSPTKLRKLQEATRYAEARLERAKRIG